jgi:hypothetical protein
MTGDSTAIEPGKQAAKLHAAPLRVPVCVCVCVCVFATCRPLHPSLPLSFIIILSPLSLVVVLVVILVVVVVLDIIIAIYYYFMQAATDVVRVGGQEREAPSHVRRVHAGRRQTS